MILNKIVNFKTVLVLLVCLGNVQSMNSNNITETNKQINQLSLQDNINNEKNNVESNIVINSDVNTNQTINNEKNNIESNIVINAVENTNPNINILNRLDKLEQSNQNLANLVTQLVQQNNNLVKQNNNLAQQTDSLVKQNDSLVKQNDSLIADVHNTYVLLKSIKATNNSIYTMTRRMYNKERIDEEKYLDIYSRKPIKMFKTNTLLFQDTKNTSKSEDTNNNNMMQKINVSDEIKNNTQASTSLFQDTKDTNKSEDTNNNMQQVNECKQM